MEAQWKPDRPRYRPSPNTNGTQRTFPQPHQSVAPTDTGPAGYLSTAMGQRMEQTSFIRELPALQYGMRPYEPFSPPDHRFHPSPYPQIQPNNFDRRTPYFTSQIPAFESHTFGHQQAHTHPYSPLRQGPSLGCQTMPDTMPRFQPLQTNYRGSATELIAPFSEVFPARPGPSASFAPRIDSAAIPRHRNRQLRLYGLNRPSVNITGSKEALQKLEKAVATDGLIVKQQIYGNDRSVFNASLKYHEDKGSWPAPEQASVLDKMNEDELLRFGITADDYKIHSDSSIYPLGEPPYRTQELNLDGLLVLLRIVPKYHDRGSPDGPRVWALGIVDKFMDNTYQAKLFRAEDGPSTHELWFVREVIGHHDDFVEVWRPFVAQSNVPLARERYTRPVPKHPLHHYNSEGEDLDEDEEPEGWLPQPVQKSKPRNLRRYNHKTARWSHYKHLSWEEILDEGKIPIEDFCGEVMLEVAACFSNKEIALRTNAWRPQETSENLVWQVIKRALMLTAGTPGWPPTYKEAYKRFEDIRVRNNVKKKEQAGRKSRIGIAPTRRDSAIGSSRKRSARQMGRRQRGLSEVSSLSGVTDDLPTFTGDDMISQDFTSEIGGVRESDDDEPRLPTRRARKLRARKPKYKTTTNMIPLSNFEEDDEAEAEEGRVKEEYGEDDDDGSVYEETGDEEPEGS